MSEPRTLAEAIERLQVIPIPAAAEGVLRFDDGRRVPAVLMNTPWLVAMARDRGLM
ncbi:hypothetical protein P1X14_16610 [Sphingomonas sp. AOB5]|uniref:hypothetical protein n=1 Tax=Sphingomonas sp. AOB5 TaxID=3034017 RepID=UPI0023F692C4|nr:hypothetical protein [Sphingomonas sp. AOB5]MDF7776881.1 hypothetical protein [Sphingomonas sp. AOB5]